MPNELQHRGTAEDLNRTMNDETVLLVFEDTVKSLETEFDSWSRRVLQPIIVSILAFSAGVVLLFFQNDGVKAPLVLVIPFVTGAALAVLSGVQVYRSRRIGSEIRQVLAGRTAHLLARAPDEAHEIESTVLLRALEVFGDSQRALSWMREANPALKNDTPLHAIRTDEGRREVLNILGRIEYGVIS